MAASALVRVAPWGAVACLFFVSAARGAPELARSADALVDTIGVSTKAPADGYNPNSAYMNWNACENAIGDIGIRYVRDLPWEVARLNDLTARTGAKLCIIMQLGYGGSQTVDTANLPAVLNYARSLTGLAYIEGPNETDGGWIPDWQTSTLAYQTALYQQVKADPSLSSKVVLAPSMTYEGSGLNNPGLFSNCTDLGNVHWYPQHGGPISDYLGPQTYAASLICGSKPVVDTEAGWHNAINWTGSAHGVSETAAAKYYTHLFFENYNAGLVKTFAFELMDDYDNPAKDDREANFGLLRHDFTYKPCGLVVKRIIHLLADPGASFTPGSLDYTITGGNTLLRHTLLQKSTGEFYLALWQDATVYDTTTDQDLTVDPVQITLATGTLMSISLYDPLQSDSALSSVSNASSLDVQVPDHAIILQLTPVPEPGLLVPGLVFAALVRWRRKR